MPCAIEIDYRGRVFSSRSGVFQVNGTLKVGQANRVCWIFPVFERLVLYS